MTPEDAQELNDVYTFLYPDKQYNTKSYSCQEVARISISGQIYASQKAKSERCSVIIAKWPVSRQNNAEIQIQVGFIKSFIKHKIEVTSNTSEIHIFACIEWMEAHIYSDWFGQSAIVCEGMPNTAPPLTFFANTAYHEPLCIQQSQN